MSKEEHTGITHVQVLSTVSSEYYLSKWATFIQNCLNRKGELKILHIPDSLTNLFLSMYTCQLWMILPTG